MLKREKFIPPSRDEVFIFSSYLVEAASVAKIPSGRDHINTL
jgi:hypothetical protein